MIATDTARCSTTAPRRAARGPINGLLDGGPAMDAWFTDDRFVVEADLPGFGVEDLDVTVEQRVLTIAGSRELDRTDEGRWVLAERPAGSFRRAFRLPFDVEPDDIEAQLTNGVLRLTAPRSAATRPRKVEIVAG